VEHDRDGIRLGRPVEDFQLLHPLQIIVREEELVRGMDLDHAQAEANDLLDVGHHILGVLGMQAATGDEPLGIGAGILGRDLVHPGRIAGDLGRGGVH
jgi:hypothetical protein